VVRGPNDCATNYGWDALQMTTEADPTWSCGCNANYNYDVTGFFGYDRVSGVFSYTTKDSGTSTPPVS
jgi:hypothetical protein